MTDNDLQAAAARLRAALQRMGRRGVVAADAASQGLVVTLDEVSGEDPASEKAGFDAELQQAAAPFSVALHSGGAAAPGVTKKWGLRRRRPGPAG